MDIYFSADSVIKKISMKKLLLGLSVIVLLTASCKKDKSETKTVTPTKENLTGKYKIIAATVNGVDVYNNSNASVNVFEACDRDDEYYLNTDLSYDVVDAGTQCSPDNNWTGTWSLTNSTTIDLDGDVFTIKSFDGTTLVATYTDQGITYSATYVKQ
jgi:hypothetical protein